MRLGDKTLRNITIFKGLTEDARRTVERNCSWKVCKNGTNIIDFRGQTREVFFLVAGKARVIIHSVEGKRIIFREIEQGEVFGEFAAIDAKPRSATVEALAPCFVACMLGVDFNRMLLAQQVVMEAVLANAVQQIRSLTGRIVEFSTLAVSNRIQAEILRLARAVHIEGKEARIHPLPTHAEIADRISTHREAVARELAHLDKIGVIKRGRRSVVVKDIGRLIRMVDDATGDGADHNARAA